MNQQLLSLAIWLPILGAVPVFWAGSDRRDLVRWLALAVAVAGFLVTIPLYTGFDPKLAGMQFVEQAPWGCCCSRCWPCCLRADSRWLNSPTPARQAAEPAGARVA